MKLKKDVLNKNIKVYIGRMRTFIEVKEGNEKELLYYGYTEFFEPEKKVSKTVKAKVDDNTTKGSDEKDNGNTDRKRKPRKS